MAGAHEYTERLKKLLPAEARECGLVTGNPGLFRKPSKACELRRWGRRFHPFDFQLDIIEGISAKQSAGPVTGMICLPTGAGKTVTAARVLLDSLAAGGSEGGHYGAWWLAPQQELLRQASEAIQACWWSGYGPDSLDIEIVDSSSGIREMKHAHVRLLTPQMAKRLMHKHASRLKALIFDEAHHAAAEDFSETWQVMRALSKDSLKLSLGLSATPNREQYEEVPILRGAFDNQLFLSASLGNDPLASLMENGFLSRPEFRLIEGVPEFSRMFRGRGVKVLRNLILDQHRWHGVVECVARVIRGQTIVFAYDREHGMALTRALRFAGVRVEYLDGNTNVEERVGVLERFRDSETRVLVNVALLIEGVDCPAAKNLVLTYPVGSSIRLRQIIGRVLRGPKTGGSPHSCVWALEGDEEWLESTLSNEDYSHSGWNVQFLRRGGKSRESGS